MCSWSVPDDLERPSLIILSFFMAPIKWEIRQKDVVQVLL
jgi:hypothetical protein